MPFIITAPCEGVCDTACVEVCPVDAIEGPIDVDEIIRIQQAGLNEQLAGIQLFIDPDLCIDCGACEPECPVNAIFDEYDVPANLKSYIKKNEDFFNS